MAGIISLYRQNVNGVLEADPVKVYAHLSSTINQVLVDLKKDEESRAQRLFEATVASPVFAEFADGEAVRDFANVLYSFNYAKGKKMEAILDLAKSYIPGFSFSLPESPKRSSIDTAATLDSGPEKQKGEQARAKKPMAPPLLDLSQIQDEYHAPSSNEYSPVIQRTGAHRSFTPRYVEDVASLPAWRFGDFVRKPAEEDPDTAAAIKLAIAESLRGVSTDETGPD